MRSAVLSSCALLLVLSGCNSAESAAPPAPQIDVAEALQAIDVNGDHLVTRAEWSLAKAPEDLFATADANRDNALSKAELVAVADGLDADKDGKLSAVELLGEAAASTAGTAAENNAG